MTAFDYFVYIGSVLSTCGYCYLKIKNSFLKDQKNNLEAENESLKQKEKILLDEIAEVKKKIRLSNNVLGVLNDLNNGGALLEVSRIDRNDVFFHNGSFNR